MTMPDTAARPALRRPLMIIGLILTVVLVATGVTALLVWLTAQRQTSGFSFGSTLAAGSTVTVSAENVAVNLQPATDGRVHVDAHGSYRGAQPQFSAHQAPDGVVIDAKCLSTGFLTSCDITVDIDMPAGNTLSLVDSNGGLTVQSLTGPAALATTNGAINASGLSGNVTMQTTNGEIDASGLRSGTASATSTNGRVALSFVTSPTRVTAHTSNGQVTIAVPGTASYDVQPSAVNGRTDVRVPTDSASGRLITATTVNGDVTVEGS